MRQIFIWVGDLMRDNDKEPIAAVKALYNASVKTDKRSAK